MQPAWNVYFDSQATSNLILNIWKAKSSSCPFLQILILTYTYNYNWPKKTPNPCINIDLQINIVHHFEDDTHSEKEVYICIHPQMNASCILAYTNACVLHANDFSKYILQYCSWEFYTPYIYTLFWLYYKLTKTSWNNICTSFMKLMSTIFDIFTHKLS